MTVQALVETAEQLLAGDRGILAIDESPATIDRRFAAAGIAEGVESRWAYRELLVSTPGLAESIHGAIIHDETIRQRRHDGTPLIDALTDAGIICGIKVDEGAVPLAGHLGEKVTEGLDGLRDRLTEYAGMGARFAKWRAVLSIDADRPSRGCIAANVGALARYAALCQETGLVPFVEPEVLMDGDHTLSRCAEVTEDVLEALFAALHAQGVTFEAVILKPNMVLPGTTSCEQATAEEVAEATLTGLLRAVPAAVPGIAFLSGGQSGELASARLNALCLSARGRAPWRLSFSFGRALHQPALDAWHGEDANVMVAQEALAHRARCDQMARRGEYTSALETAAPRVASAVR